MNAFAGSEILTVAQAEPDARAAFIRRTYAHLAGAIAAFVGLEIVLLRSPLASAMLGMLQRHPRSWLLVLGAFILVGVMARRLAASGASVGAQYAGLAAYVFIEAIIFIPILFLATAYSDPKVLPNAAILTGTLFLGLTLIAFTSRSDFSFLRGFLSIGFMLAFGAIVCGVLFGFNLGLGFSIIMVGLASAAILYDTAKIIRTYPPDRHVAASLELFASVALLFWYVLRIMMSMSRR